MASPAPHATEPLEADDVQAGNAGQDDDVDSAVALSVMNSSQSLRSSIVQYRVENGRTYHAFRDGRYVLPNDESENDRLDLQHHLFGLTFDQRLFTCPAGRDRPIRRVLDAGTGTGIWAADFADLHPEAEVIGVDLSAIQPNFVPPNVRFFIDDLEDTWTFSAKFDFIYARMLTGAIKDWPSLIGRCYENLTPGGWLEIVDISVDLQSDDDTIAADSPARKWASYMLEAAERFGAPIDSCTRYKQQMEAAGFVDVMVKIYKWPTNSWPRHPKYKEIGIWALENIGNGASGLSIALLTRALGWTAEQVEVFLVDFRRELKDRTVHGWWPIYVVYGRRP